MTTFEGCCYPKFNPSSDYRGYALTLKDVEEQVKLLPGKPVLFEHLGIDLQNGDINPKEIVGKITRAYVNEKGQLMVEGLVKNDNITSIFVGNDLKNGKLTGLSLGIRHTLRGNEVIGHEIKEVTLTSCPELIDTDITKINGIPKKMLSVYSDPMKHTSNPTRMTSTAGATPGAGIESVSLVTSASSTTSDPVQENPANLKRKIELDEKEHALFVEYQQKKLEETQEYRRKLRDEILPAFIKFLTEGQRDPEKNALVKLLRTDQGLDIYADSTDSFKTIQDITVSGISLRNNILQKEKELLEKEKAVQELKKIHEEMERENKRLKTHTEFLFSKVGTGEGNSEKIASSTFSADTVGATSVTTSNPVYGYPCLIPDNIKAGPINIPSTDVLKNLKEMMKATKNGNSGFPLFFPPSPDKMFHAPPGSRPSASGFVEVNYS